MQRFLFGGGIVFGICLMLVSGASYFQRQESPPPYWILYDVGDLEHQTLYLSSPDGHLSKPLLHIQRPANLIPLDWLADNETFLYQINSPQVGYQLRSFNLRSAQSTMIVEALTANSGPRWQLLPQSPLNTTEWRLIFLRSDEGHAVYRINHDASIFERITPYHSSIDANNTHITTDGEWLFYQASDGGNLPHGLFCQRIDGTDHLELFRFQGSLLALSLGDGIYLYISNFSAPQGGQSRNYEVRVDGREVDVTETDADARGALLGTTFESGWSVFNDFSGTLGPPGQLYRQHRDGGDPELLLGEGQRMVQTNYDDETVLYIQQQGSFDLLMAIDIATLETRQLSPDEQFSEFRSIRSVRDPASLVFEAMENGEQAVFRLNAASGEIKRLMTFDHINVQRYRDYNFRSDWVLLSDYDSALSTANTTMYRLNVKTGEWHEIATFPRPLSDISVINSPDPNILILSATDANAVIIKQVYVNYADGQTRNVHFGGDVVFGAFKQRELSASKMVGIGVMIVGFMALGGFVYSRRNDSPIAKTPR